MQLIPRLLVVSFVAMLSEVSLSSFFLRRGCVQRRRRLKVLVAQNKTPEQIRVLGGAQSSAAATSNCRLVKGRVACRVATEIPSRVEAELSSGLRGKKKQSREKSVFLTCATAGNTCRSSLQQCKTRSSSGRQD